VSEPSRGGCPLRCCASPTSFRPISSRCRRCATSLPGSCRPNAAAKSVLDVYDEIEDGRAAGQTFEEIAASLDLPLRTVEVDRSGVDAEGETTDLPASDEVLRTAFDLDVGIEADPVSTRDDGFVWVDLRDVMPATVRPFEDARDEARAAWKRNARRARPCSKRHANSSSRPNREPRSRTWRVRSARRCDRSATSRAVPSGGFRPDGGRGAVRKPRGRLCRGARVAAATAPW
jgi:hypothetical protein